jgi:hypothetical protein
MKIYDGKQFREMTEEELAEMKNSTPVEEMQESPEERIERLEKMFTHFLTRFDNIFGADE